MKRNLLHPRPTAVSGMLEVTSSRSNGRQGAAGPSVRTHPELGRQASCVMGTSTSTMISASRAGFLPWATDARGTGFTPAGGADTGCRQRFRSCVKSPDSSERHFAKTSAAEQEDGDIHERLESLQGMVKRPRDRGLVFDRLMRTPLAGRCLG
jgi:hypothetical protein